MPREYYHQLPTSGNQQFPSNPPSYDETNFVNHRQSIGSLQSDTSDLEANIDFEEFEIDDPDNNLLTQNNASRLWDTAGSVSRSIGHGFCSKIVLPITGLLDPISEAWHTISVKFDVSVSKFVNPLVFKRFLYVVIVSAAMYVVISSELSNRASINGLFNDLTIMSAYIKSNLDPQNMQENLEYLSSIPHMAGTAGDLVLARYIYNVFSKSGIDGKQFDEMRSFINYPDNVKLELKKGEGYDQYTAELMEPRPPMNSDDATGQYSPYEDLPFKSFNFLSRDGKVDAPVVYVNYGRTIDYQTLESLGVNFQNSICFTRYGKISTPSKIKIATNNNCKAMVFFKDPKYMDLTKDEYRSIIEKQMVSFPASSPGNVLTPGWPSFDNDHRVPLENSKTAPEISSIPVSYKDVLPFFIALKSKGVNINTQDENFKDWEFGNDQMVKELGYSQPWTGTADEGAAEALLEVETIKRESKELWNIIGKIEGSEQGEKAILIGAQRDSGCFGAINPNTGTVVLLELIKIFTGMQRELNWQPLRSIYFMSIDGSEYNYAGITEWAEVNYKQISEEIFTYIDLGDTVSGDILEIMAHPAFEALISDVLNDVNIPIPDNKELNENEYENDKKLSTVFNDNYQTIRTFGNSYPFLSFVGTPVVQVKYTNAKSESPDEYSHRYPENSCFDTFQRFQDLEIDPNMKFHLSVVDIISQIMIKLVDEPIIPYSLDSLVERMNSYLEDLTQYCSMVSERKHVGNNKVLNIAALKQSMESFRTIGDQLTVWLRTWTDIVFAKDGAVEPSMLTAHRWEWNRKLIHLQRFSINESSISNRTWVKNMLFAPQIYEPEFYKHKETWQKFEWWTFPSIRDAVYQGHWDEAQREVDQLTSMVRYAIDGFFGR
ncbi:hypothetical protein DASC09_006260 [Saccharomycopsis crataegensis]|uniref:Transferrin receptor-like dimerisation domain-containing protein n=1 Tax=Saccharomycopsis crataegensis TaxID=43959 RepID=A0AAV5QFC4_9ASCO|nr:hypothetical protein DASC09_006260 [Saccharomycopsis crataegensis]